ncbi:MAG: thioredoxin family protein [Chloroflexota bacterium]|nr:thioredoxin family protein [Chloroflexota bacterium]
MGQIDGEILLIDVRHFPRLGREVAFRTRMRHESPQVIVLRDGEAVWAADHRDISVTEITEVLRLFP